MGHHRGRHDELSRQDAARFAFLLATSITAATGAPADTLLATGYGVFVIIELSP